MSELAYDEDGQHFLVPAEVARWRIRRFNNPGRPGGPQVVYGDDGLPLFLDVDATAEEFRAAVGARPGRYRLDGVDAAGRLVEGVPPAYLMINAGAPASESSGGGSVVGEPGFHAPPATTSSLEYAMVELARANCQALTTMTDRFSSVCDAMATVVRAVDGAGLPRRAPLGPLLVDTVDDEDDDDGGGDDGERNAAPPAPPPFAALLGQVMQMVQAFAQMNSKGPAGPAQIGAVMGQVVETAKVVEAVATAPREPDVTESDAFTDEAVEAPTPIVRAAPVANDAHEAQAIPVQRSAGKRATRAPAGAAPASIAPANSLATSAPAADPAVQFQQIMAALTPEEQTHVQMVITRLSMGELMQWYEQLARMSVAEGVAKIRAELARLPMERAA